MLCLSPKHSLPVIAFTLLFFSPASFAIPFFSFDPRSMAMGSVGVAVAAPGTAPFFNPALLAVSPSDDDFTLQLPIVGARIYNPDRFKESLDEFINADFIGKVEVTIDELNSNGQIPAEAGAAADSILVLSDALYTLSDKRIQLEAGGALVVGIPSSRYGAALSIGGWAAVAGRMTYRDEDIVREYTDALYTYANSKGTLLDTADMLTALGDRNNDGEIDDPTTRMKSDVTFEGIVFTEIGLSLAREFSVYGKKVAIGIQPKMVTAIVFDYHESVAAGINNQIPSFSDISNVYSNFNLDIGFAKQYGNGWRTGFVVRNLIDQYYTTPSGTRIHIGQQMRLGISKREPWFLLALDLDINNNPPIAYEEPTHFIAFGAELYYLRWGAVRVGYRINTTDTTRNVASFGLGIGTALDLAIASNKDETGAAIQLGFSF